MRVPDAPFCDLGVGKGIRTHGGKTGATSIIIMPFAPVFHHAGQNSIVSKLHITFHTPSISSRVYWWAFEAFACCFCKWENAALISKHIPALLVSFNKSAVMSVPPSTGGSDIVALPTIARFYEAMVYNCIIVSPHGPWPTALARPVLCPK